MEKLLAEFNEMKLFEVYIPVLFPTALLMENLQYLDNKLMAARPHGRDNIYEHVVRFFYPKNIEKVDDDTLRIEDYIRGEIIFKRMDMKDAEKKRIMQEWSAKNAEILAAVDKLGDIEIQEELARYDDLIKKYR